MIRWLDWNLFRTSNAEGMIGGRQRVRIGSLPVQLYRHDMTPHTPLMSEHRLLCVRLLQSERILLLFRPAFACETELPTWYCCRAGCRPFVHLYLATKMLSAAGDSSL